VDEVDAAPAIYWSIGVKNRFAKPWSGGVLVSTLVRPTSNQAQLEPREFHTLHEALLL
jgi:hypothetical protein